MIRLFLSRNTLDWVDVSQRVLNQRGRLPTTSMSSKQSNFTKLQLAHAIAKTDVITTDNTQLSFLIKATRLLIALAEITVPSVITTRDSSSNLRVNTIWYPDFMKSALIGRIGQGLALLNFQEQGYNFVGHYSYVCQSNQRGKGPDFVLEGQNGQRAFLEAKSSMSSVKQPLRRALAQIRSGLTHARQPGCGQVAKGYATAVLLRSPKDSRDSIGYVVDPTAPTPDSEPIKAAEDRVLRANYGSWLEMMGFQSLAKALLYRTSYQPQRRRFVSLQVSDREVVFKPLSFPPFRPLPSIQQWNLMSQEGIEALKKLWERMNPEEQVALIELRRLMSCLQDVFSFRPAVGLDRKNLEYLSRKAQEKGLLTPGDLFIGENVWNEIGKGAVSVFSDTTAFGILPFYVLRKVIEIAV